MAHAQPAARSARRSPSSSRRGWSGLSGGERELLELLALGEPLRVDELGVAVGAEALVDAETRGLVTVEERGDDVRLAHPLYGETIAIALPSLRGRELRAGSRASSASAATWGRTTPCASRGG